jgi:glycosyltransferase involved in cell wall biosynthesis
MNADLPMISIVTPCLNRSQFIEEAIQSVLQQDYPHVEHIVVDGGSIDGTLEILRRYHHLRVISEPDNGLYDALNKAIRLAKGEIIGQLNSDDSYADNIFSNVARRFVDDPELDTVCGGATVFDEDAEGNRATNAEYQKSRNKELSFYNITLGVPIINARFFRRRVYERVGLFDMRYPISADRDFLMRVAVAGVKSASLEGLVYHYRRHPDSLSINREGSRVGALLKEHMDMSERYLQRVGLPPEAHRHCRLWHTRETFRTALQELFRLRFRDALRYMVLGWHYDAAWSWSLACMAMARVFSLPRNR